MSPKICQFFKEPENAESAVLYFVVNAPVDNSNFIQALALRRPR
jgi:hypothetical protein